MNTLDEALISELRAELDALTASISEMPPRFASSVSVASVVAMPPRRDRRRVLVLAAAMVALIAAVGTLAFVRHGGDAVGSTDSSADTTPVIPVVTLATAPLAAHPIPPTPAGWDLVEWGNVRLSLPPDLSPFHTGNGCVANGGEGLEVQCGDEFVHIEAATFEAPFAQTFNGFHAQFDATECDRCQTLEVFELNTKITVRWDGENSPLRILDTVGPSGQWRFGNEVRPFPPAIWKEVTFEGVAIRVPAEWPVQTVAAGELSPCPQAVIPNTVLLDSGVPSDCDDPVLVAPADGVRLYIAKAPLPTHPGWAEWNLGSQRDGPTFVVARVGFGVDPGIGTAILSSFADAAPDTSSTHPTIPLAEVPYVAVGDSVMLGAKPNLESRGITTAAEVAKGPPWEIEQLQLARSKYNVTRGVVIQVGTNGTVTREQYEAVLAEVADVPTVVVMTVKAPKPWIAGNNEIIRSLPSTHPNVVVLDWEARSVEVADHLASDGVHLGDDVAKDFYADVILQALGLPT